MTLKYVSWGFPQTKRHSRRLPKASLFAAQSPCLSLVLVLLVSGHVLAAGPMGPRELPKPELKDSPPLFQEWSFDKTPARSQPIGFTDITVGGVASGLWRVAEDQFAPSRPHILTQEQNCPAPACYHLLYADTQEAEYFDLSVRVRALSGTSGGGGLLFGNKSSGKFYAIMVSPDAQRLEATLIEDGQSRSLGTSPLKPAKRDWHFLRIQRNTIISQELIEFFFDNQLILSLSDASVRKGQFGLVASRDGTFAFDNLRVVELLTSRPLSRPPAY